METKPLPAYLLEDFGYYEGAVDRALQGEGPYSVRVIGKGFFYPPPALLLVGAFHAIDSFVLKAVVYSVFNVGLLLAAIYAIAHYYGLPQVRVWYWYVLGLCFAPFLELLHVGQINLVAVFGVTLLFLCADRRPIVSGIGLALAVVSKLSPVLFFGYLVVHRLFKVVTVSIAAIAFLLALSVLFYGWSPVVEYPGTVRWLFEQFPSSGNSQSLAAKLVRASIRLQPWLSRAPQPLQPPIANGLAWLATQQVFIQRALAAYVVLAIGLSSVLTIHGRQAREPLFLVTALGMTISPNVMWYHHYVFLLPPLFVWMGWRNRDTGIVGWCLFGLLVVQTDRYLLTHGLLVHVFSHLSILAILYAQCRDAAYSRV